MKMNNTKEKKQKQHILTSSNSSVFVWSSSLRNSNSSSLEASSSLSWRTAAALVSSSSWRAARRPDSSILIFSTWDDEAFFLNVTKTKKKTANECGGEKITLWAPPSGDAYAPRVRHMTQLYTTPREEPVYICLYFQYTFCPYVSP
jgi:hypothetical protein